MRTNSLIYILLFAVLLFGCKTAELTTEKTKNGLPKNYIVNTDTTSVRIQKWRELIFDEKLRALIDSALTNNFDLQIALQKVEISKAGIRFAKGIRLPEVGVVGSASQRKFGDYTMDGVGNYDTQFSPNINDKQQIPNPLPDYYVGVQASWEIDLWGKLKNKKKAAAAKFIASQHGRDLIVTNLIAEISTTYFELLALDNELEILENNIQLQQGALDVVIIQKQSAKANELAVEMMKAQLLNSKSILVEVKQKLIECESKLNFLVGSYPGKIVRDTLMDSQNAIAAINAGIPSDILVNRPDIRQAEMELKASNADVKSAKAAFYPTLNINSLLGLQSFNVLLLLEAPASLVYNAAGSLAAPLLNRRKLKADLMTTKAEQKQAYINYEKNVVNGFVEVYNSLNNIKNTKEMYDTKSEEVEILKQSIFTSSELFKAGRANYMEVILAQKNALQSQLELVNYKKRQNTSLINLYRSLGGGWQ
ncbi:MAG: efflux transporter outer membrane subunit [Bacteroidia bacterium]|nr:efflux transporter outer membrane subunit [Bacteroidia bacterium]